MSLSTINITLVKLQTKLAEVRAEGENISYDVVVDVIRPCREALKGLSIVDLDSVKLEHVWVAQAFYWMEEIESADRKMLAAKENDLVVAIEHFEKEAAILRALALLD